MIENYKAAYLRQKKARIKAEQLLEDRSRELYESNQTLLKAYKTLKQQKSQMLHKEKLASIGQLSAGVAHEINNPAGYVKSNLNTLIRYIEALYGFIEGITPPDDSKHEYANHFREQKDKFDINYIMEDLQELVDDSQEGMERISSIIKSLKDFARPSTEEIQPYCLNTCIQNTLKLVNNEIKYKADVILHLGDIPMIKGQSGNVGQVFLNILVNAAQSIDEKGEISVSTRHKHSHVITTISDTGSGIPEDILDRIFDPFFTTKDVGEGTGLGLSIVHGIVKKQGGDISINSDVGKGTTFTITLPINGA